MKSIILFLAVAAFVGGPMFVSSAQAKGAHLHKAKVHAKHHHGHHKSKHHKLS